MFLGVEIGGTKLQVAVGEGRAAQLVALERRTVDPAAGAAGILRQIAEMAEPLIARHGVTRAGIGFGGPVDAAAARVIKSHHIDGWDDFDIGAWCQQRLGVPCALGNDADLAALAEAHFGAGQGANPVFYITIGTGIGGGLVVDGRLYRGHGNAVAEIGHLRPGLSADRPDEIVESLASGLGIAAVAQARLAGELPTHALRPLVTGGRPSRPEQVRQKMREAEAATAEHAADLLERCGGQVDELTARHVVEAAAAGNLLARDVLARAWQALGWAIAQVITLVAPQTVVIGGGVSAAGEALLFAPLREEVARYVFPPLAGSFTIRPAQLGEEMVLYGALALAAQA